jgi:hypothetical protein
MSWYRRRVFGSGGDDTVHGPVWCMHDGKGAVVRIGCQTSTTLIGSVDLTDLGAFIKKRMAAIHQTRRPR